MSFTGFSQQTIDFLVENRRRNSRDWFVKHRREYTDFVINPFRELVTDLTDVLLAIDPRFSIIPQVNRSISRLNRDTRFSSDKSLYRDVMWCVFMREKKLFNGFPGFYFELHPGGYRYGCGYYVASKETMESLRQQVVVRTPAFLEAHEAFRRQRRFVNASPMYCRSRDASQPADIRAWLDMKSPHFVRERDDVTETFSPKLVSILETGFCVLAPIYHFFLQVENHRVGSQR
ncbi:MAG: DUF2461 family protein [Thermoguttaceae bacterium]